MAKARSKWVEIFNKNVRMPGGSGLLAIVTSSSSSSRCPPKWKWMRLDAICFRINRGWARKVSSLQQRLALQNFIIFIHPLNFLFVYATTRHHTNSCKISIQKLDIIFPTINTSVCFNHEFFNDSWHSFAPSIMQNNCNSCFRSIFINAFSRKNCPFVSRQFRIFTPLFRIILTSNSWHLKLRTLRTSIYSCA